MNNIKIRIKKAKCNIKCSNIFEGIIISLFSIYKRKKINCWNGRNFSQIIKQKNKNIIK